MVVFFSVEREKNKNKLSNLVSRIIWYQWLNPWFLHTRGTRVFKKFVKAIFIKCSLTRIHIFLNEEMAVVDKDQKSSRNISEVRLYSCLRAHLSTNDKMFVIECINGLNFFWGDILLWSIYLNYRDDEYE